MSIAQELERLAQLHAEGALTAQEFTKAKSQLLSSRRFTTLPVKGIRRQSSAELFGLPLWAVAIGPDWEHGEMRGHARGIFALGDIATGWVACGGMARGVLAIGGLAIGLVAFGGGAIGVLLAAGGGALADCLRRRCGWDHRHWRWRLRLLRVGRWCRGRPYSLCDAPGSRCP